MKLVELSNLMFFHRSTLREEILNEYRKQGITPSEKMITNNPKYKRLLTCSKLLSEVEGVLEASPQFKNKYKMFDHITNILQQQSLLHDVISQQQLKQKTIRENFLKYLENVLLLRNEPMTTKEVKKLAESVNYQVRNINDFLKMAITKSDTLFKVKQGVYNSKDKIKIKIFS